MIQDCTETERKSLEFQICPDCQTYKEFLVGPRGGFCQNIRCSRCGSEFNAGPLTAQRISGRSPKLAVE